MVEVLLLFGLGLVLMVKGGDSFVDGAWWIAQVTGIPPFIIAATIVSVATTMPELMVSALAAAQGSGADRPGERRGFGILQHRLYPGAFGAFPAGEGGAGGFPG